MRKHHVFRPLSGLGLLCLFSVFVAVVPATTYAHPCDNIPQLQKEARAGNAQAQADLGVCYFKGWGVAKDERRAVELYRKSAEQGDAGG